jgi:hypothetical protein
MFSSALWLFFKTYWKPLAGALVAVLVAAAVGWYGHIRYEAGYAARDTQAKLDEAAQKAAFYTEKTRLENERNAADEKYQTLKSDTAARAADIDAQLGRLRKQLSAARSQHVDPGAAGGVDGGNTDWIGVVGTCWGDYAGLAKEAAVYADRVNGLQGYVRAIQR